MSDLKSLTVPTKTVDVAHPVEAYGNGTYPAAEVFPTQPFSLQDAVDLLRRRWKLVCLTTLLVFVGVWQWQHTRIPQYTSDVMVRRQAPVLQLEAVTHDDGSLVESMEVLRSRTVLEPLVDSLRLQVIVEDRTRLRSRLFSSLGVDPRTRPGVYKLAAEDGRLVLRTRKGDIVATSPAGERLVAGGGLTIVVKSLTQLEDPIQLRVIAPPAAINRVRSNLVMEPVARTGLLRLSYTSPDPILSANVVDFAAANYQRYSAMTARSEAMRRRQFIEEQMRRVGDSVHAATDSVLKYLEATGSVDPNAEGEALNAMLIQSQSDLRTIEHTQSVLQAVVVASRRPNADMDNLLREMLVLGEDVAPGASRLYTSWQEALLQKQRLTASSFGLTERADEVIVLDSVMGHYRDELRALAPQWLSGVEERKRGIDDRIHNVQDLLATVPGKVSGLAGLQQEVQTRQQMANMLATRYYEAQVAEATESGDVSVVDPAIVPLQPDDQHKQRNLMLALAVGLLLGGGLAVMVDLLDTRARSVEDVERASGLRVITAIPNMLQKNGGRVPLPALEADTGALESFRMLRTMIRFARVQRTRVVAVTSPGPSEGKSMTTANLALTYAKDGERVLLIDADLRRPSQNSIFATTRSPGLVNVLVGEVPFEKAVQQTPWGVELLTAGDATANSGELLGSDAMKALVREQAANYDRILIDTAPVLAVADAYALAPCVEGMLLVVRVERTPREVLRTVSERLSQVGTNVLGTVLNGVSSGSSRYGHYYGRYGHYTYGSTYGLNPESTSFVKRLKSIWT